MPPKHNTRSHLQTHAAAPLEMTACINAVGDLFVPGVIVAAAIFAAAHVDGKITIG